MRLNDQPTRVAKELTIATRRLALPWLRRVRKDSYTDADPFKIIFVPTDNITHMQKRWSGAIELPWLSRGTSKHRASLLRRWHAGMVLDGDWARATERFDGYHLSQVLSQRFEQGKDWRQIPYIKKALRKVNRGEPAWGNRCRTEAEVLARCRYLDALYERLKEEGYRFGQDRRRPAPGRFTHLIVNIGRDGSIIRNNDGKHRIILSKIIDIPRIPARVFLRHREWQAVRDTVRLGTDPLLHARFRHHPDLQDLPKKKRAR